MAERLVSRYPACHKVMRVNTGWNASKRIWSNQAQTDKSPGSYIYAGHNTEKQVKGIDGATIKPGVNEYNLLLFNVLFNVNQNWIWSCERNGCTLLSNNECRETARWLYWRQRVSQMEIPGQSYIQVAIYSNPSNWSQYRVNWMKFSRLWHDIIVSSVCSSGLHISKQM